MHLPATPQHGRRLILFLGSNIGNFDPPGASAFLHLTRRAARRGDWLLLGVDLVKPERDLMLAYDDPLGVTAAFNKNLLLRLNAEAGTNFKLEEFRHEVRWNRERVAGRDVPRQPAASGRRRARGIAQPGVHTRAG